MRIDSHQHFWKYDPIKTDWIDDSMKVIQKDFLPKDLFPILKKNSIDGCIAVQANQSEEETEFLLSCAKDNSFIKGVVGWVDLTSCNVEDRLAYFSKDNALKGIRHIVQAEKENFMTRSDFQNGISKLKRFNLVYDILIHQNQLNEAIRFITRFPEQVFVLNHIGKPAISEGISDKWKKEIQILGKHDNVFCKLSGMVTETNGYNWEKKNFQLFLETVLNAFGSDKLLYGSDWPVNLLAASYKETLEIIHDFIADFSISEKQKIMGLNATKVYSLKESK